MEKSESKGQFQKIFAKRKNRDLIFFHSEIVEKKKLDLVLWLLQ
jgi:hypothetical protein